MAGFLGWLGRWCARHRRVVYTLWAVIVIGVGYLGATSGGTFVQTDRLPGTPTQEAVDELGKDFPEFPGPSATIVFHPQDGVQLTDWRVAVQVGKAIDNVRKLPRIAAVENPYAPDNGGVRNDNAVVAVAHFKGTVQDLKRGDLKDLQAATDEALKSGVNVEIGGMVTFILNQPKASWKEGVGLGVAGIVLLLAFGSYLAAAVPIVVSMVALGVATSLMLFGASQWDISPTAPLVAAMLGLGAGIDYALFVVTRHRRELGTFTGDDAVERSIGRALATAGHAVVFAGGTVVFAICGLWLVGIGFVGRIGLVSAVTVALMVVAALTLLPAILGSIGDRIDRYRLRLPSLRRRSAGPGRSRWDRWGRHVDRHAWPYAILSIVVLAVLALPALSLRFGVMSDSNLPEENSARRAYDVVEREFGPGYYAPFFVIVRFPAEPAKPVSSKLPRGVEPTKQNIERTRMLRQYGALKAEHDRTLKKASAVAKNLSKTPGVAQVIKPVVRKNAALIGLVPTTAPDDKGTADLTHRLRDEALPAALAGHQGGEGYVGGTTTVFIDMADQIRERMFLVVGAVVGVAVLLLIVMFRSILVPLKAALMNLLSIGASYGVVIAVFQWGWGIELTGLDKPVPLVSFVPLFMFAVIFGLSMDYEVFLLSRIKEEYDRTGDPHGSVVAGIGYTARLITSAALIMISVFLSFLPQPDPLTKMMSVGLAVAVAVDATIVRLVLVPALMSLLGHANWWFPGRRRRAPVPESDRELELVS